MGAEVRLEFDGALATLTLSHPGKLNAMSVPMWRSLRTAAGQLAACADLRAVIVRGEAGQFCAGGDIAEYPGFRFHREGLRAFHEEVVWPALEALLRCDVPLISQIGQQLAASLLMFGFALLAPFLWASAMRFRLGATRWRGIRLAFTATWKEVYIASWPAFAIAALWTVLFFAAASLSPAMPTGIAEQPGSVTPLPALGRATLGLMALGAVLTLLCVIRLEFNYRRLLVARARIGGQVGHWKPRYADFVRVWLATAGFFLLTVLLLALAGAAFTGGSVAVLRRTMGDAGSLGGMLLLALLALLGVLLAAVLASVPARAYREARLFQLVWNNVGISHIARSKTDLRTAGYVWLRTRNLLLTLLTFGFYRPFALVSEYAAKVRSVTLYLKGGTDQLAGELVKQQGAFGDAAADMLGLDVIG